MLTIEQYSELKNKINKWQTKTDKAMGRVEELQKTLKTEFGVESLEEAKELQSKLERQCKKAESQFMEEYKQFQEKWESVLN